MRSEQQAPSQTINIHTQVHSHSLLGRLKLLGQLGNRLEKVCTEPPISSPSLSKESEGNSPATSPISAIWKMGASASYSANPSAPPLPHSEKGKRAHLVDRDNSLAILHARKMLNRSTDPDSNVQLRRNDLARLPDLLAVIGVPAVDRSAGSPDSSCESIGEGEDDRVKVLLGLDAATTRDDGRG